MSKATDKILGELHGKLAKSMINALNTSTAASELLEEYRDELPGAVVHFLSNLESSNPALLTAVSKFLKDNDITCAIEDDNKMTELEELLKNKQRKRVGNVVPIEQE